MLFGDEVRNERGTGWTGEGAADSDEEQDRIDGKHAVAVEPVSRIRRGGAYDLQAITDEDDLAAVEAVGDVSRRKEKQESGKKEGQAGVTKVEGAMGNGVDLPGDGDRLRLRTQDYGYTSQLVAPEIARIKGLQTAPGRLLGEGRRHLVLG